MQAERLIFPRARIAGEEERMKKGARLLFSLWQKMLQTGKI